MRDEGEEILQNYDTVNNEEEGRRRKRTRKRKRKRKRKRMNREK